MLRSPVDCPRQPDGRNSALSLDLLRFGSLSESVGLRLSVRVWVQGKDTANIRSEKGHGA